ncbi:unnamed protein product [Phytophthora fragariaefolia]|uniref:Unnamed protein product n=1 Tax=Phytophthora fragariaefolia TaxID=1490495 RepID=A0A9W6U897_9STRA|nr:unnamed protein product [Phytophthora fragariaefolia]
MVKLAPRLDVLLPDKFRVERKSFNEASFTAKGHPQTGQSESVVLSQMALLLTLPISSILSLDTAKITHIVTSATMGRPRINDQGKKRKSYQWTAVTYSHKQEILNYIASGHNLHETIEEFYGKLPRKDLRSKKKQINKWMHQASTIRAACESGRGHHHNIRDLGAATVLPKAAEEDIVLWLNTLRKDGSPVSRVMLQLQAMHLAKEHDLEDKFAASPTWVKLFLRRHRLSLRARTQQGQTTPEDAQEAAKVFRTIVLKTIVEKKCIRVFNADQTALLTEEPFILTPPNRVDITEWISTNWGDLSIDTIVSVFAKVGILIDTRVAEAMPTEDAPQIESCIVEELENCNLVDGKFGSDDDIENESDSDDESNL